MTNARKRYEHARQELALLRAWAATSRPGLRDLMADLAAAEQELREAQIAATAGNKYPIPGHADAYATEDGTIWQETDNGPEPVRIRHPPNGGYPVAYIRTGDSYKSHTVHRLLCLLFHGRPGPDQYIVRHLDDDRYNNSKANLAWGNNADNEADRKRNGRYSKPNTRTPKIQRITEYIPATMFQTENEK